MSDNPSGQELLGSLLEDTEYVLGELSRGDAVSPEVLAKAKPFVDPLVKALLAAQATNAPGDKEYCTLQSSMIDLMTAIAPVTVTSLKDTECSGDARQVFGARGNAISEDKNKNPTAFRKSPVEKFSDSFLWASGVFLFFAVACTITITFLDNASLWDAVNSFLTDSAKDIVKARTALNDKLPGIQSPWSIGFNIVQTVLYGGLGACVYLMRALHKHIHERTFDKRHKPEYLNRVLLGMASGAVITILVTESTGDFLPKAIGPAALAFLIGYNTDLLFSLIERVSSAIFPKVPDPPAAQTAPPVTPSK
jgi:hypothetical protein